MNKLIPILIIIIAFGITVYPAYSQTIICHDQIIIHIIQLDGMIECLDQRINAINITPSSSPFPLDDLTDVDTTGVISGKVLKFNGTFWIDDTDLSGGSSITHLDNLTDVVIVSPSTNQVFTYNGTHWVNDPSITLISTMNANNNNIDNFGNMISSTTNPASVGKVRFAQPDLITWRNTANTNNHVLLFDTNDVFTIGINNVGEYLFSATNLDMNDNSLKEVGDGGDIINLQTELNPSSPTEDFILVYDTSAGILKKTRLNQTGIQYKLVAQQAGSVYFSLAKTNLATTYVDIYVTAFDEENQMIIDCANVTYGKIIYQWDFVGAGNDQLRWVDASNNANVFYESPTFTTDRDATDSGFFVKPSWCTTTVTIEWQGKSSNGTNDPVAKGYKIMVK